MARLTISLSEELLQRTRALAEQRCITVSALVREMIEAYLFLNAPAPVRARSPRSSESVLRATATPRASRVISGPSPAPTEAAIMSERHPVQRLLLETFPKWRDLAPDCAIRRAFEADQNFEPELIGRIEALGVWDAMIRRMQVKHPVGRPHRVQHDLDLFNVRTEARAAVWAYTAGLGIPEFIEAEGEPDLKIDSGWVEAKRILPSDAGRKAAVAAREKNPVSGFRMADPIDLSISKACHEVQISLRQGDVAVG
jgi:hypothetical protein